MTNTIEKFIPEGVTYKAIHEVPGFYVCSDGMIVSLKTSTPRYIVQNKATSGYLKVTYSAPLGGGRFASKNFMTHRIVAKYFYGERTNDWKVRHKDGVQTNNASDNLEYVQRCKTKELQ